MSRTGDRNLKGRCRKRVSKRRHCPRAPGRSARKNQSNKFECRNPYDQNFVAASVSEWKVLFILCVPMVRSLTLAATFFRISIFEFRLWEEKLEMKKVGLVTG